MAISTENTKVARCDLEDCKAVRYGSTSEPPVGFYTTTERVVTDADGTSSTTITLFACSTAHLNKALVRALSDGQGDYTAYGEHGDHTTTTKAAQALSAADGEDD